MKTTLMKTQFMGSMASSVGEFSFAPRPSNREWLPVPQIVPKDPAVAERALRSAAWGSGTGGGESKLMGFLMLLGAAAVAYGCWMLLQLAENWGAFQAGIGRLVE